MLQLRNITALFYDILKFYFIKFLYFDISSYLCVVKVR